MALIRPGSWVTRRNFGPVFPGRCSNCRNLVIFRYIRETSWFRFVAVPLFPYAREHLQACPLCSYELAMPTEVGELARSLAKQGRVWGFDDDTEGTDEEPTPLLSDDDVDGLRAAWGEQIVQVVIEELERCGVTTSQPLQLIDSACGLVQMGEPVDVAVLRAAVSWP